MPVSEYWIREIKTPQAPHFYSPLGFVRYFPYPSFSFENEKSPQEGPVSDDFICDF